MHAEDFLLSPSANSEYKKTFKLHKLRFSMADSWLKKRKVTAGFATLSLISGFLFLNRNITGNAVLSDKYSVNPLSLIGLLLVICAVILAGYSIKR